MKLVKKEMRDLLIAWLIISLAFAILFSKPSLTKIFLISFAISSLTVGIGFLLHELAHKFLAQKYNLHAEFHAFYDMLFLSLLFSFFGFIIAAPGAVFIKGKVSKEKNGKISLMGPLMNIFLASLFFILLLIFNTKGILYIFLSYGLSINSLLALFNLIPFSLFDGKDVYSWNKKIYFIAVFSAFLLFLSSFLIF